MANMAAAEGVERALLADLAPRHAARHRLPLVQPVARRRAAAGLGAVWTCVGRVGRVRLTSGQLRAAGGGLAGSGVRPHAT